MYWLFLEIVAKFRGDLDAQSTQLLAKYTSKLPFDVGQKETAPPIARQLIEDMFAGYDEKIGKAGKAAYQRYAN